MLARVSRNSLTINLHNPVEGVSQVIREMRRGGQTRLSQIPRAGECAVNEWRLRHRSLLSSERRCSAMY